MAVAAPADKRFRRAHVRPARRRSWMPSWPKVVFTLAVAGIAAYGAWRGAALALSTGALTITRVTVTGAERMSPGEVLAVLDGLRGASIVTTSLEPWRQKLLGSPWVADASIRRVFPGTVTVAVSEREPLGIGRIGTALYLIDERGTIIDEFGPSYAEFDLPIIDGLAAGAAAGETLVDEGRAALAGRLLSALQARPDLATRISQVDVSDLRDAAVILKDDPTLIRVGDERFVERLQAYLDLAPRLREQVREMEYVDMRFDERVYVRPLGLGGDRRRAGGS